MFKLITHDKWPFRMVIEKDGEEIANFDSHHFSTDDKDFADVLAKRPETKAQFEALTEMVAKANGTAPVRGDTEAFADKILSKYYDQVGVEYPPYELYKINKEEFRRLARIYKAAENVKVAEFKKDALEVLGLSGHPKAERAWEMSWEYGHSDGLYEVWYHLEELSELMS